MRTEFDNIYTLRPWKGDDGRSYYTDWIGRTKDSPQEALYTKLEWAEIDGVVAKYTHYRMPLINALLRNNLVYSLPRVVGSAPYSTALLQGSGLKLPFTHHSVFQRGRDNKVVRSLGPEGCPTLWLEASARRVAEELDEVCALGSAEHDIKGIDSCDMEVSVFDRGIPPAVLRAIEKLHRNKMYGQYIIAHGTVWDMHLDQDYAVRDHHKECTVRDRIAEMQPIAERPFRIDVQGCDRSMWVIQATTDVVRVVDALRPCALQFSPDDLRVVACMVPQVRKDHYGTTGIVRMVRSAEPLREDVPVAKQFLDETAEFDIPEPTILKKDQR